MSKLSATHGSMTDVELLALYADGYDSAFTALTDRYIGLIRSITSKYRVSGLEPEDLTQEGLLGLLFAAKSYKSEGGASFKNYAALCIDRRVVSLLRRSGNDKSKALNNYVSIDDESYKRLSGGVDPEDMYIDRESLDEIKAAITGLLSERERKVLRLYIAGDSYASIAQALGMDRKAVDNAMQRIRRKLRDHISSISL